MSYKEVRKQLRATFKRHADKIVRYDDLLGIFQGVSPTEAERRYREDVAGKLQKLAWDDPALTRLTMSKMLVPKSFDAVTDDLNLDDIYMRVADFQQTLRASELLIKSMRKIFNIKRCAPRGFNEKVQLVMAAKIEKMPAYKGRKSSLVPLSSRLDIGKMAMAYCTRG